MTRPFLPAWIGRTPPWLAGPRSGPGRIALATRVRLARNLDAEPFPGRATAAHRRQLQEWLDEAVLACLPACPRPFGGDISQCGAVERAILQERNLISRELARHGRGSGVLVGAAERLAVMVNEEDHLRLQALLPGLALPAAARLADELDSALARRLPFAFDERLGYLTACPSNVGTGLRASVMLHLPALRLAGQFPAIARAAAAMQMAVRGPHGEGSEPAGSLLQISNQSTLGESEEAILARLQAAAERLVASEEAARERLLREGQVRLLDQVGRAWGILRQARLIETPEAMDNLSLLLLGSELGLFTRLGPDTVRPLFFAVQPGQIQFRAGATLDAAARNRRRADLLRERLAAAAAG
ncbi:MAG: ATP--guanido phosphotransferase [Lentisphaeria bacterium]|jgi:protein arginine kinase